MQKHQPHVSHFAQHINLPICSYIDSIRTYPNNPHKSPISFLAGDPTIYGEKSFAMPQRGYQILKQKILDANNHGYGASSGNQAAKKAIISLYKPKIAMSPAEVFINHGVNMGLLSVLIAFTNQGDQVLVPELGYPFFHDLCPAMKRTAIPYKLNPLKNYEIDLDNVKSLLTQKTAFIYVINPTNPLGTVFSKAHMLQILTFSDEYQVPIVSDEVYYKQVYPGVESESFGDLTEDVPVIVLSGYVIPLSKSWCTSWTIVFDKNNYLDKVKQNLGVVSTIFLHPNVFTQAALPSLISEVGLFTSAQMGKIEQKHKYVSQHINKLHGLSAVPAQGTIYMSVKVDLSQFNGIGDDKQFAKKLQQEESVAVLPLSAVGTGTAGFRLLTCAQQQTYDDLLARLGQFVNKHKNH